MIVEHPIDAKNCFIIGNSCLARGSYDAAQTWFEKGVYAAGHDFTNYHPVTEALRSPSGRLSGGYLVQDGEAARNFNGLSHVYYRKALELARTDGLTPEVRELIQQSEACARKASDFDVNSFLPPGDFWGTFESDRAVA